MIEDRQIAGGHHDHLRHPDVIGIAVGDALSFTNEVVGEIADHSRGERRQLGIARSVQQTQGLVQHVQRASGLRQPGDRAVQRPGRLAAVSDQGGDIVHADE